MSGFFSAFINTSSDIDKKEEYDEMKSLYDGETDAETISTSAEKLSSFKKICGSKIKDDIYKKYEINGKLDKDEIIKMIGNRKSTNNGFGDSLSFSKFINDKTFLFDACIENRKEDNEYSKYDQVFLDKKEVTQEELKGKTLLYHLFNEESGPSFKILSDLMDFFESQPDDADYEKIFDKYISEYTETDEVENKEAFKKSFDELKEKEKDNKVFFMVFSFAWNYVNTNIDNSKMSGGNTPTVNNIVAGFKSEKMASRMLYVFSIIGLIYFSIILLDAGRLLLYVINHIMDIKQKYRIDIADNFNADDAIYGENTLLNYTIGFFMTFSQFISGNVLNMIEQHKESAINSVQQVFTQAATETGRNLQANCMDNILTCFNGIFTGQFAAETSAILSENTSYERQKALNDATHAINTSFNRLSSQIGYVTTGITTGLNGILMCCCVIGNLTYPDVYTKQHVTGSVGLFTASYSLSPLSITSLSGIATQFSILFAPGKFRLTQYTDSSSDNSTTNEDNSKAIENLTIEDNQEENVDTKTVNSLLSLQEENDKNKEEKKEKGGKKRKSKKFFSKLLRKKSTKKKKVKSKKKNKRKTRRKTIKRRNKKKN